MTGNINQHYARLRQMLERHEEKRYKPYDDDDGEQIGPGKRTINGKLTGGIGRNLEDVGFSNDEIDLMLSNDIKRSESDIISIFPYFSGFSKSRQDALLDMIFNLGKTRFLGFKKMIAAIKNDDWKEAKIQAMDSTWATRVGYRAKEVTNMFEGEM